MLIILLGALLVIAGVALLACSALARGRRSKALAAQRPPSESAPARGMAFLGVDGNWPGIAMLVVGAALLLVPPTV